MWDLYTFDRQLRLIVFVAIERVEIYFRTQLAYELARTTGPFRFNDKDNLPNLDEERYERFGKCKEAFNRSREPFAIHFKKAYGNEHELLDTRSEGELRMMGFMDNWESCPLWAPWLTESGSDSDFGSPVQNNANERGTNA